MKKVIPVWLGVFIPWVIYRLIFRLSESADELLFKPLVFIFIPLIILKVRTIPGFESKKKVFEDTIIGVAVGTVFAICALLANKLKYGNFLFNPVLPVYGAGILLYLFLSLATSISEEILNRGFFFNILRKDWSVPAAATVSSLFSLSLHLPIIFTRLNLNSTTLLIFLCSVFLLSMVNCYLYESRKSLVLPILVHMLWNMTVALYL